MGHRAAGTGEPLPAAAVHRWGGVGGRAGGGGWGGRWHGVGREGGQREGGPRCRASAWVQAQRGPDGLSLSLGLGWGVAGRQGQPPAASAAAVRQEPAVTLAVARAGGGLPACRRRRRCCFRCRPSPASLCSSLFVVPGDTFRLRIIFSERYPLEPPEVRAGGSEGCWLAAWFPAAGHRPARQGAAASLAFGRPLLAPPVAAARQAVVRGSRCPKSPAPPSKGTHRGGCVLAGPRLRCRRRVLPSAAPPGGAALLPLPDSLQPGCWPLLCRSRLCLPPPCTPTSTPTATSA